MDKKNNTDELNEKIRKQKTRMDLESKLNKKLNEVDKLNYKEKYEEALDISKKVVNEYKNSEFPEFAYKTQVKIGQILQKQKKYEEAIEEYKKILTDYPPEKKRKEEGIGSSIDGAIKGIFYSLIEQNKYDEAEEFYVNNQDEYFNRSKSEDKVIQLMYKVDLDYVRMRKRTEPDRKQIRKVVYEYFKILDNQDYDAMRNFIINQETFEKKLKSKKEYKRQFPNEKIIMSSIFIEKIEILEDDQHATAAGKYKMKSNEYEQRMAFTIYLTKIGDTWKISK